MGLITDKLEKKLSRAIRKLSDMNIKIVGTEAKVLRLTTVTEDLLGQKTTSVVSHVIDKIRLQYPTGDIRLILNRDNTSKQANTDSFDLWDILPIKLQIPFEEENNYDTEAIAIEEGDIIVHVFFDEHGNKIPIVMQVKKPLGNFRVRYMVRKEYHLTLLRSTLDSTMQTIIDNYVTNLSI